MINNPLTLRRYDTIEYAMAHLSALYDGADIAKKRVARMTNLEALHARGFVEDYNPRHIYTEYVHKETGLRIIDDHLMEMDGFWKHVDRELEFYRKQTC